MTGKYVSPMVALGRGIYMRIDVIEMVLPPHPAQVQACLIAYSDPPESVIIADGYKGPIPCTLPPDEVMRRIEIARTEILFAEAQGVEAAVQRTQDEAQKDPKPRQPLSKEDLKEPPKGAGWLKGSGDD